MKHTIYPSRVKGSIDAPASKSYAQRAVAAALLCDGTSRISGVDLSNDTSAALETAQRLGAKIIRDGTDYIIQGSPPGSNSMEGSASKNSPFLLNIGESGLSARLFTPVAALWSEQVTITGEGSIMGRPVDMMIGPLQELGVEVESNGGKLPLTVHGPLRGGEISTDGSLSSQFITGLLTALPLAERDSLLRVAGLQSVPYIDMTLSVLKRFGITIENRDYKEFFIKARQKYHATDYRVEGDWSGASCMLVAGAIGGEITIDNLNPASVQADRVILDALEKAGAIVEQKGNSVTVKKSCLKAFGFDATHCPDLFPALAALAAYCEGDSTITGTERLTHKESDRAKTIAEELGKLGVNIDISSRNVMKVAGDIARLEGSQNFNQSIRVSSRNDHRIAMAAATVALGLDRPVEIDDAQAVDKSYPAFWKDLESVTQQ